MKNLIAHFVTEKQLFASKEMIMFAKELEDLMLKYDVSIYRVFNDEKLTRIEFFFRENQKLRGCVLEQKSGEDIIVYEVQKQPEEQ